MGRIAVFFINADQEIFNSTYAKKREEKTFPGQALIESNAELIKYLDDRKAKLPHCFKVLFTSDPTNPYHPDFPEIKIDDEILYPHLDAIGQHVYKNSPTANIPSTGELLGLIKRAKDNGLKQVLFYWLFHSLAATYPCDEIVFEYIGSCLEDLYTLHKMIEETSSFLPNNFTFYLSHYDKNQVVPFKPIKCNGLVDKTHDTTIKEMIKNHSSIKNFCKVYNPKLHPEAFITDVFNIINHELESALKRSNKNNNQSDHALIKNLKQLINSELESFNKLSLDKKSKPQTIRQLQNQCVRHIAKIDQQLTTQSSYTPLIINLFIAITIIGTLPALYSLGVRITQGHWGLFNSGAHLQKEALGFIYNSLGELSPTKS